ncbi:DUF4760 domain-containing protein [Maricaulis sp.]|uniref:DUF4760 domain-containing protein n=1 Tax=Maricaulis sp. TaxID=1486257 RepID=UPI003A9241C4
MAGNLWTAIYDRRFHLIWMGTLLVLSAAAVWLTARHWTSLGAGRYDFMVLEVLVISFVAAMYGYRLNYRATRLANSFQHIAVQTRDGDLIEMFEEFRVVRRSLKASNGTKALDADIVEAAEPIKIGARKVKPSDVIKKVFNYYEATAIGVKRHALDEAMIRSWWRKSYILDWMDFAEYIRAKRKRDRLPRLFIEYESLVRRWANEEEQGLL